MRRIYGQAAGTWNDTGDLLDNHSLTRPQQPDDLTAPYLTLWRILRVSANDDIPYAQFFKLWFLDANLSTIQ